MCQVLSLRRQIPGHQKIQLHPICIRIIQSQLLALFLIFFPAGGKLLNHLHRKRLLLPFLIQLLQHIQGCRFPVPVVPAQPLLTGKNAGIPFEISVQLCLRRKNLFRHEAIISPFDQIIQIKRRRCRRVTDIFLPVGKFCDIDLLLSIISSVRFQLASDDRKPRHSPDFFGQNIREQIGIFKRITVFKQIDLLFIQPAVSLHTDRTIAGKPDKNCRKSRCQHFLKNEQHSSVLLSNDPFLFHEPVLLSGFFRHGCFSILYPTPQTTFR